MNSELIEEPYYPNERALFPPFKRATHGAIYSQRRRTGRSALVPSAQLYSQSQRSCVYIQGGFKVREHGSCPLQLPSDRGHAGFLSANSSVATGVQTGLLPPPGSRPGAWRTRGRTPPTFSRRQLMRWSTRGTDANDAVLCYQNVCVACATWLPPPLWQRASPSRALACR